MSQQAEGSPASGGATNRADWSVTVPAEPLRLEDARLLEYRHPSERPALAVSVAIIVAVLVAAVLLDRKEILVGIAGIWVSMVVAACLAVTRNRLRGIEVTPTQFPGMYQIVEEVRERFQVPPTRVFVARFLSLKPETLGFRAPYVIVLPSLLVSTLSGPDELRYVLGQEFGHIRFGHTRRAILLGGDRSTLPAILSWLAGLRDVLFAWYRRTEVMSSDRAGIVACGSVRVAVDTQIKLTVGPPQFAEIRPDALVEQAFQITQGRARFQAPMVRLMSVMPPLIYRLHAMVAWAGPSDRSERPVDQGGAVVRPSSEEDRA